MRTIIDKTARYVYQQGRILTNAFRQNPEFLIVGAQKAGSTSLYDYIVQHPKVKKAKTKEVHFFTIHYGKGKKWYKSNFPIHKQDCVTGEATPFYLYHCLAPSRIYNHYPNIKLIIVLREPVSSAVSHYYHTQKHGFENRTFAEAI